MVSSYSTEVNKTMFVFFHLKVSEQLKTGIIFWLWNIFNCFPIFIPRLACKKLFYRSQLFYSFFLMKSPDFILLYSRISSIKEKKNSATFSYFLLLYFFSFSSIILMSLLLSIHDFHSSKAFSLLISLFFSANNLELPDLTKCWKLIFPSLFWISFFSDFLS